MGSAVGSIVLSQIFSWSVGLKPEPEPVISFIFCSFIVFICCIYVAWVFSHKEWRSVKSSRLSTDVPDTRPLTEDDFVANEMEENIDDSLPISTSTQPLLNGNTAAQEHDSIID